MATLALTFWATGALAQAPEASPGGDEPVEEALDAHPIVLADPAYKALQTAWREIQADLDREAWLEASGRLSYLVDLRTDMGIPNIPHFATVLMRAAENASANGAKDAAAALASAAAVLAPDLVSPQLAVAQHRFDNNPLGLTDTIRSLRNALERLDVDLASYVAFRGNGGALWINLVILLGVFFSIALFTRYNRFAASDIRRVLPKGVTLVQAEILLIVGLAAPFLAGLGLVVTVIIWLIVLASYLRPTERLAVMVLMLAICTLPAETRRVVRAMTYESHPASVVQRCNIGLCSPDDKALLKQWAADEVYPFESHFMTALTLLRHAGTKGDTDSYELAKRYAQTAHDIRATRETHTLLGNLAYMRGTRYCEGLREKTAGADDRIEKALRDAVSHWKEALSMSRAYVPALYNSSVALTQLGDHVEADPLLERAMRADHERVLLWTKNISRDGANLVSCKLGLFANRQVMLPALGTRGLRYSVMNASVPYDGLVLPFSGLVTGRLGTGFIGVAGLGGVAALILLWLFAKLFRPTMPCSQCGNAALPNGRLDTQDGPVCGRCIENDVRRAFIDAKKQWVQEQQNELALARRQQRARLVTWLLPGFGHLLRGKALRGILYLGLVAACLLLAFDLHSVVDDPNAPLHTSQARTIVFLAIAGCAYVVAIIDAHAGGTSD